MLHVTANQLKEKCKKKLQVHIRTNRQSGSEMDHGIWVGKAPMTDEDIILRENGVQKARSLHRVAPEERFLRVKVGGGRKLKSDDCDAARSRPVWTSTCVFDDQGRSKAWCNAWLQWLCRFGTTHRRLSSAIGKGIGRWESRSCRNANASVFIIRSCCADANTTFQNEQMDSPMELGPEESRERKGLRPSETPRSEIH